MNQKQAILVFFLCLAGLALVLSYFFYFFPIWNSPESSPLQDSPTPGYKQSRSTNPSIEAQEKIQKYHNSQEVEKLLEIIKTPAILGPAKKKQDHARFRALAIRNLVSLETPAARQAYLKLLDASTDPKIVVAALSALDLKKATPEIKETIKKLILKTRNKLVRTKASLVYEKLP